MKAERRAAYAQKPFEFVRKVISNVDSYLAYTKGLPHQWAVDRTFFVYEGPYEENLYPEK